MKNLTNNDRKMSFSVTPTVRTRSVLKTSQMVVNHYRGANMPKYGVQPHDLMDKLKLNLSEARNSLLFLEQTGEMRFQHNRYVWVN